MVFEWRDAYSVGVKTIDDQHKQLINTINSLAEMVGTSDAEVKTFEIFNQLTDYAKNHFATEEYYFEKYKYEFKEEHMAKHNEFRQKVSDLEKEFKNDKIKISFDLIDYLEDWLLSHLLTEDRKYIPFMKKNGVE